MRAIDGKHHDTSLRLVFASVPVQALMMAGAVALAVGGLSASHEQSTQVKPASLTPAVVYGVCPPGQFFLPDKGVHVVYPAGPASAADSGQGTVTWPVGKSICMVTETFGPSSSPVYLRVETDPGCC